MTSTTSSPWSVNTRTLVLAAVFGAMVIALQLVGIGSIPVPNLSGAMTTLLIPVILGALIGGPWVGMFAGLVMGVIYLTLPATAIFGPITLIIPRLLFPLAAWAVYRALKRNPGSTTNTAVAGAVAGGTGALVNTICAVGLAILLGQLPGSPDMSQQPELIRNIAANLPFLAQVNPFIPLIIPQAIIELVGCAIIIPLVMVAVEAALKSRSA